MIKIRFWILLGTCVFLPSACQNTKIDNSEDPLTRREQRYDHLGKLFGEEAFTLGDNGNSSKPAEVGIGVNRFLWQGSLETLSFMPLKMVDPFGGVILTDWYTAAHSRHERIKVDVLILSRDLRADGLRVTVFRQTLDKGQWVDQPLNTATAEKLEEAIMVKARDFRIKNRH